MSVNGSDLSQAKQDEAVAVLKVSQGNVKMKVRRYRVRSWNIWTDYEKWKS